MTRAQPSHGTRSTPSPWIVRWSHLIQPRGTVLDVACGAGRHLAWFAGRGHQVTGVDRDLSNCQDLADQVSLLCADIESGPWPLQSDGRSQLFDAVIVTHYLWRPLLPTLLDSLAPGGVLLYETFAAGNETVGRPARPDFLLQQGELLQTCRGLDIVAYENGFLPDPARCVQRVAAVRPFSNGAGQPSLYTL